MVEHFVEVKELKVENCFLEWRMTDNCLVCKHFVALVKSKDGNWKCVQFFPHNQWRKFWKF